MTESPKMVINSPTDLRYMIRERKLAVVGDSSNFDRMRCGDRQIGNKKI
jgi:hypothetical protein